MKRLTCEMCGSTDLMKQDGVFVCQSCGCKYSVEEAKKMLVEGTVDVSGSKVKVDDSEELEKLYQVARRAKESNNSENAAKYYDMILMKDPNSWEANFYTVYYKSMNCKIGEIRSAIENVENCIEDTFNLIKQHVEEPEQRIKAVDEVLKRTDILADLMESSYKRHFDSIPQSIKGNYLMENVSVLVAAATAKTKPIRCIIYLLADDEEFMLNYGYAVIKKFMKGRDGWRHAEAARKVLAKYDEISARKKEEEKERKAREAKERFDSYWEAHAEEKEQLGIEQVNLKKKIDELNAQITAIDTKNTVKINALRQERDKKLPCEIEVDKQRGIIRDLEAQRDKCSIFKGKEKKAIQARLDTEEKPKLQSLRRKADAEKKAHQDKFNAEISAVMGEGKELRDEVTNLKKRSNEIDRELTQDR